MGPQESSALLFVLAVWLATAGLAVCFWSEGAAGGATLATATAAAGLAFWLMRV